MRPDTMIDGVEEEVDMLDRHLEVLHMVVNNEPIGIVKMSNELGYDHHEIRYSLRILEEANLIEPTQQGAITADETKSFIENLDGQIEDVRTRLAAMKISE
jgi:predicted transcriptional regulator